MPLLTPPLTAFGRAVSCATWRFQLGDRKGALADLDWILEKMPEGIDLDGVRTIRRRIAGPER